jgi:hypothetical protein
MKKPAYTRGKYNKVHPKEKKITFLTDKLMVVNLKQLSQLKQKSVSHVIREAIQDYYSRATRSQNQ